MGEASWMECWEGLARGAWTRVGVVETETFSLQALGEETLGGAEPRAEWEAVGRIWQGDRGRLRLRT